MVTDFILQFPFTVIKLTCIYNDDLQLWLTIQMLQMVGAMMLQNIANPTNTLRPIRDYAERDRISGFVILV